MKSKLFVVFMLAIMVALPSFAFAQSVDNCGYLGNTIQRMICQAGNILSFVLPFLIALAVIIFVWGVVQYVISSDEEAKKTGRDRMIWGIIGIAVIVSLWGLVKIVTNTFGTTNVGNVELPDLFPGGRR